MSGGSNQGQQVSGPPEWLQGAAQQYLGSAQQQAARPYQQYQGVQVAPFTGLQNAAFQGIGNTMYGNSAMGAANGALTSILGGGSNPYLDQVLQRGKTDLANSYNAATSGITGRFNDAGSWGNSAHMQAQDMANRNLALGLSDLENNVRYGDYNNSLNRQLQAAPLASQLAQAQQGLFSGGLQAGNLQQQYGQALADAQRNNFNDWNNYGWNQLNNYGNAFGRAMGGAGQVTTTTPPSNTWSNLLGTGLLAYGMLR